MKNYHLINCVFYAFVFGIVSLIITGALTGFFALYLFVKFLIG